MSIYEKDLRHDARVAEAEARNIYTVEHRVSPDDHWVRTGHRGGVLWLTGLSGSGKSTVALGVELALHGLGYQAYVLDGDNVRAGLNKDLGFSPEARHENLRRIAEVEGLRWVVDGTNCDDLSDYRPGRKAAQELGVRSPLLEAGLTKADIRRLAFSRGMPNWDKPANPCLASRIPYGTAITAELAERISAAEETLAQLGLRQFRVRHHGDIARIEVSPEDMALLIEGKARLQVVAALRALGYSYVALDLAGYRPGSMNLTL